MIGGIGGALPSVDFNPQSISDIPEASVQAKLSIAALKMQQDAMKMQGEELARMIEPHKGGSVDSFA